QSRPTASRSWSTMATEGALCICVGASTSIPRPLFAITFSRFYKRSPRHLSSLISVMSLMLTALASQPSSKDSAWHACGRRHCACRACKVVFFIYFRLSAYRLCSKTTAAEALHQCRRCLNGKYSRRCWKEGPQRTRLCREPEHSVVVHAARHKESIALCW